MDKIKILYIEDDAGQRKQFAEQMAAQGFKAGPESRSRSLVGFCRWKVPRKDPQLGVYPAPGRGPDQAAIVVAADLRQGLIPRPEVS